MKTRKHFGDVHGDIVKNILGGRHPCHGLWNPILVSFSLNASLAWKYHFGDDCRGYHTP